MEKINGQRIYPDSNGNLALKPGDYGKSSNGEWLARPPSKCHTGSLSNHEVIEHEDGTISVSPSILVSEDRSDGKVQWHGFLKKGIWQEV